MGLINQSCYFALSIDYRVHNLMKETAIPIYESSHALRARAACGRIGPPPARARYPRAEPSPQGHRHVFVHVFEARVSRDTGCWLGVRNILHDRDL